MKYFTILADSFKIFWKYKTIWLIGIVLEAAWTAGNGVHQLYYKWMRLPAGWTLPPGLSMVDNKLSADWPRFLLVYLALEAFMYIVITLAMTPLNAALYDMVYQAATENTATFQQGWQTAKRRLWPLFWTTVILGLPFLLFEALSMSSNVYAANLAAASTNISPEAATKTMLNLSALCCAGGLIIIPFMVLNMIQQLGIRACVLEASSPGESIRRGWELLRKHPGYSLLTFLILGIFSVMIGVLMDIPAQRLWTPLWQAFLDRSWSNASLRQAADYLVYFVFAFILIEGLLNGFIKTVWTRLYGEFVWREGENLAGLRDD
jgi:hypothetical protein